MKANELKRGAVIINDGKTWAIRDIDKSAPTSRSAVWTFRFKLDSVPPGARYELTVKGEDDLETAELLRRPSSYSYMDGDNYVFMDNEDYTQYLLSPDMLGDAAGYVTEGLEGCYVAVIDEQPVALQLPPTVTLEVVDTAPELKGATATKRPKPAKLSTGIEIQVPEYVTNGEKILVSTITGEFSGRA